MGLFDSPSHILIVLVVLVLLFGSAKLPKLAKSLGESMRIFKRETQKLHDDGADAAPIQGTVQQQVTAQPPPPAQHVEGSTVADPAPAPAPVPDAQRTNQPG